MSLLKFWKDTENKVNDNIEYILSNIKDEYSHGNFSREPVKEICRLDPNKVDGRNISSRIKDAADDFKNFKLIDNNIDNGLCIVYTNKYWNEAIYDKIIHISDKNKQTIRELQCILDNNRDKNTKSHNKIVTAQDIQSKYVNKLAIGGN